MCRIRNRASSHDRTASHSTIEKALCNFVVAILDDLSLPLLLCSFHLGPTGICYCPGAMVKAARRDATNRYAAEQELLSTFRTSRGTFLDDQQLTSFGSSTATLRFTKPAMYFDRHGHVSKTADDVAVPNHSVGSTERHDGALRHGVRTKAMEHARAFASKDGKRSGLPCQQEHGLVFAFRSRGDIKWTFWNELHLPHC